MQTTDEQRQAIGRGMVGNVVDWFVLASIARERGEKPLDLKTITRFPQMDEIQVGGFDFVGCAYSRGSRAKLRGSDGKRYSGVGVRRLVGQRIQSQ